MDGTSQRMENIRSNQDIQIEKGNSEGLLLENTMPTKVKTFPMAISDRMYSSKEEFTFKGIQWDICCGRCGAQEESINHVFFECPPAIHVWALSKIPSNPTIFPTSALFTNLDHLFWRVVPQMEDHQFAWIIWYI